MTLLRPASASPTPGIAGRAGLLERRVKQRLKRLYATGQQLVAQALFAYSPQVLESAIGSLGIGRGDSVLVHSAFARASGFTGGPRDVIETLLRVVGPTGHVLMMSIPYRGSSRHYAEADTVFDPVRTPSAVGVISELFRRREDVRRSASPLHPVLAWGPLAAWLVADHDKSAYSCGTGTPFERLLTLDGKFLFFDAPFRSLTFMHYVEHQFRDRLPVDLYNPAPAVLRVKDRSGQELAVRQFVFSDAARARRNFSTIERALRSEGSLLTARVGNTRLLSVSARGVLACAERLVEQGAGFYTQAGVR